MKSVGIEIGQYSIKWVELDTQGKNVFLSRHGRTILNTTPGMDHELQLMETLREVVSQFTDSSTKIVISIGQDRLSMKLKRFPFKEKHKILKALPFELEDELPLSGEDILYDFKPVNYYGRQAEVLAIAVPSSEVLKTLSSAADSGIDPDILSVESVALANLLEGWWKPVPVLPEAEAGWEEEIEGLDVKTTPPSPARAILHLGHNKSLLLIFRDDRLLFSRSIYWGGLHVAQSISKAFSIPVVEAIKGLPDKSFILLRSEGATKDQLALSHAVTSAFEELVRETKISLLEASSLYNLEITRLDLTGSLSLISNLPGHLTQKLEIPVNPFRYMDHSGVFLSGWDAKDEAIFSLPLGLALESYKKPASPAVNLRKNEFQKRNRTFEKLWNTWKVPAQAALALFLLFFVYSVYRSSLTFDLMVQAEDNLTQKARTVAKLNPSRTSPVHVLTHIQSRKKQIQSSETAQKLLGLQSAMSVMKSISQKLPPPRSAAGATPFYVIHSLNVDFDRVQITGSAQSQDAVRQVEQSLQGLARGGRVQRMPPQSATTPGEVFFGFEFQVDRL